MKLKTISGTNVQGATFSQPLAEVTCFHGRNFAGKTTRVNALALALCHQVPGVAVRPSDIHELFSSGSLMEVLVEAENGEYAGATWTLGPKGKVSFDHEGSLTAPPLLFSTAEFLDLGPKDRTQFLFRVLPLQLDTEPHLLLAAKIKNLKLEPHTKQAEEAVEKYVAHVSAAWAGRVETVPIQEWLQNLTSTLANEVKNAVAQAKTYRQTVAGNVALREDGISLADSEARLNKAKADLQNAAAEEARALQAFSSAERLVQEAKEFAGKLVALEPESIAAHHREAQEAADIASFLAREDYPGRPEVSAEEEIKAESAALAEQQFAVARLAEVQREIKEFDDLKCCPTCQNKTKTWKKAALKSLHEAEAQARQQLVTADNKLTAARSLLTAARAKVTAERLTLNNISASRRRLAEVKKNLDSWKASEETQAPAQAAQERLPKLTTDSENAGAAYSTAQAAKAVARDALATVENTHKQVLADAAMERTVQLAAVKAEEFETLAAIGKLVNEMLTDFLNECIQASVSPLTTLCNDLCGDILPHPLVFEEGEIRMVNSSIVGRRHSHRTFSGTERALTYAAISVALAAQSSSVKLVILDELGRLDKENKTKVLGRLLKLIQEKKIDQAILIDTEPLLDARMEACGALLNVEVSK